MSHCTDGGTHYLNIFMSGSSQLPPSLPMQVAVGDFLPVATGSKAGDGLKLARVVAVERVQQLGVFMPHTLTGTLVPAPTGLRGTGRGAAPCCCHGAAPALLGCDASPPPALLSAGAIVVDGVAATELTSFVPPVS